MTLYMEITKDEYELPVAVAESPTELARITGYTRNAILSAISHDYGKKHFIKIDVEDDEGEEE